MAAAARTFMDEFDVPAFSVAIAKDGRIHYAEAFGFADREGQEKATPDHLFRIASISKPITSVAIFKLIEAGKLTITDRVFGAGAILSEFKGPLASRDMEQITVEHLLTHTCGGWPNDRRDPMFRNLDMNHAELIEWTLRTLPLDNPPGTKYAYSNFGYCVLGRVIEKLTGAVYQDFVQSTVLKPCGISDMHIGGNTLDNRYPAEVKYYAQQGRSPYGMNVTRMDSHGGWIARPSDLALFASFAGGFGPRPDALLSERSRKIMSTPSSANPKYAKGWVVNAKDNWSHNGSLPGTFTMMARLHSGFCWAGFTNTRAKGISDGLDLVLWRMASQVKSWKVQG